MWWRAGQTGSKGWLAVGVSAKAVKAAVAAGWRLARRLGLANGTVSISADLNIYLNGGNGFNGAPFQGVDVDIILEKGGSLSSCNNARLVTSLPLVDILNNGTGSFLSSGKGKYTCDSKAGEGEDPLFDNVTGEVFNNTGEVPDCKACPACL